MDAHFSEETLKRSVKALEEHQSVGAAVETQRPTASAELRFDNVHTALRCAYLAHLAQHSTQ
ncbi:MAG: hypothetical protein AB7O59_13960 [Pirellulales bacterium]